MTYFPNVSKPTIDIYLFPINLHLVRELSSWPRLMTSEGKPSVPQCIYLVVREPNDLGGWTVLRLGGAVPANQVFFWSIRSYIIVIAPRPNLWILKIHSYHLAAPKPGWSLDTLQSLQSWSTNDILVVLVLPFHDLPAQLLAAVLQRPYPKNGGTPSVVAKLVFHK